ncbi:glycoside hydrolase family 18 protein [Immersiella caudata]|uniref:Glycoside hydrolase family 18 protein n=1 Tax=Immersiella caudata TaxID=314043 RepID=A0AA39TT13_9PEZI|nr:glycoside hydrolase family 18 protein [Immersiella caudata]
MKFTLFEALGLLASFVAAAPPVPAKPTAVSQTSNDAHLLPRLVLYYQTTHDSVGRPISMLPLITEKHIALTHLLVCSFHINRGSNLTLNDYPPHFPLFSTMWEETKLMKEAGVKVMGMVGGAAAGSFDRDTLDGPEAAFEHYYAQLRDAITMYELEGMDIDVEQPMSQKGITRLVRRLRADFGPDFIITLAPVSTALAMGGNLSGFSYPQLENEAGKDIAFYNAQFYNGWGDLSSTAGFDSIIRQSWDPTKILAGQVTTPANGGGFVSHNRLNQTINELRAKHGEIGGIMGWEYFNSKPGDTSQPWLWAQVMTAILRPNLVPQLTITRATAEKLTRLWHYSGRPGAEISMMMGPPNVDYMAMINA